MDKEVARTGTEEVRDSQDNVDRTRSGSDYVGFRAPKSLIKVWSECGDAGDFRVGYGQ